MAYIYVCKMEAVDGHPDVRLWIRSSFCQPVFFSSVRVPGRLFGSLDRRSLKPYFFGEPKVLSRSARHARAPEPEDLYLFPRSRRLYILIVLGKSRSSLV